MGSVPIELFPGCRLHFCFLSKICDAPALLDKALAGDFGREIALINPHMVCCLEQLEAAAARSLLSFSERSMKSKTLHTELLLNLSAEKNISAALKRVGIQPDSTSVCAAYIAVSEAIIKSLADQPVSLTTIVDFTDLFDEAQFDRGAMFEPADLDCVRAHFKISEEELASCGLNDAVVARIALKGVGGVKK